MDDQKFMRRCLELGREALENGDAPVGSIVVINGEIVAEGIEAVKFSQDPTAHAETIAIRRACEKLKSLDLSGAILYTNSEPCLMCAYPIRQTGISKVVFAVSNRQIGAINSKFAILTAAEIHFKFPPPLVESGVLETESENLMLEFQKLKSQ